MLPPALVIKMRTPTPYVRLPLTHPTCGNRESVWIPPPVGGTIVVANPPFSTLEHIAALMRRLPSLTSAYLCVSLS